MASARAVIYCRCSTEEESQVDALHNQVVESEVCVREQGWSLVDRYVESKSGTTTKGRTEYNRLFEDLLLDRFDIIVIKSQDRLMRNVKDWYLFLDRMLTHGKRLFMYIERKFYSADDALITGIKAILAEEYSRELSKKINNAHRNRQKNGKSAMLTSRVFGFQKCPDGSIVVVEEEAEIIKKIYSYCAAGYGSRTIANILLSQGCRKRTGNALSSSFIVRMIRNPLYKGTMVMNRLHFDFETKKTIKNPKDQWICKEGMVPAIVSGELWERANAAMTERAKRLSRDGCYRKGSSTGKYDLSGKIVCGQCGRPYYRTWRRGYADREKIVIEWKCSTYLEKGRAEHGRSDKLRKTPKTFKEGCDNVHLEENVLFSLLEQVSCRYFDFKEQDKKGIIDHAISLLQKALEEKRSNDGLERIEEAEKKFSHQKELLLDKLLEGVISDQDYRKKNADLEAGLEVLQEQKAAEKQKEWEIKDLEQRIEEIKARLLKGGVERASVSQMLQDIQKIVVHEWHIEICFDPLRVIGLSRGNEAVDHLGEQIDKDFTLSIDYPFSPKTEKGRCLDRERIVEIMRAVPDTTARQIAAQMGRSLISVQSRIRELRKEGRIRFNGKGGHGTWEVSDP